MTPEGLESLLCLVQARGMVQPYWILFFALTVLNNFSNGIVRRWDEEPHLYFTLGRWKPVLLYLERTMARLRRQLGEGKHLYFVATT
jgi:hypothetical protein